MHQQRAPQAGIAERRAAQTRRRRKITSDSTIRLRMSRAQVAPMIDPVIGEGEHAEQRREHHEPQIVARVVRGRRRSRS